MKGYSAMQRLIILLLCAQLIVIEWSNRWIVLLVLSTFFNACSEHKKNKRERKRKRQAELSQINTWSCKNDRSVRKRSDKCVEVVSANDAPQIVAQWAWSGKWLAVAQWTAPDFIASVFPPHFLSSTPSSSCHRPSPVLCSPRPPRTLSQISESLNVECEIMFCFYGEQVQWFDLIWFDLTANAVYMDHILMVVVQSLPLHGN